jgi:methyl-accepting chemotaxis protein
MKLSMKLFLGFLAIILVVVALGATGFVMFRQVDTNVAELSGHSLAAVRHATSVERSAFETIQEENNYLLYKADETQARAVEKLKSLMSQLNEIDKLASKYNDAGLAAKSAEVKKVAAAYGQLYDQAVTALRENRGQEQLMDEKGSAVGREADAFMDAKKADYIEAKDALAIVNNINAWVLEMRFQEKSYMLDQSQLHISAIERNIASLLKACDALEKLHPNETEKKQINNARVATQEYLKAVKAWVAEYKLDPQSAALADYAKIMNRSGDTVSQMVDDYLLPKQGAVEKITESMFIVRDVGEAVLNLRIHEKAYILTRDQKQWDELDKLINGIPGLFEALRKVSMTPEDQQRIQRASKATEEYHAAADAWARNDNEVRQNILPKMKANGAKVIAMAQEAQNDAWRVSDQVSASTQAVVGTSRSVIVVAMAIGIAVGFLLSWLITRSITGPINRIIDGLDTGAAQVAAATEEISSASQNLAEGSSEQAAAIEETSSSLEQMSSMTRQNAENAGRANQLMVETREIVGQANQSMTRLTTSMSDISKASEQTQKIIKTIDEIAFQTNLLALNAAVEAARAGEAGAGFAVVADEVRNLAMRAAEAARTTASLIEDTVKSVRDGSEMVELTTGDFSRVAAGSTKIAELISEIAAASQEQAQGIDQVNKAVSEMDKVVQQNAANAEESAAASEELNAQAEQMRVFVGGLVTLIEGRGKATDISRNMPGKALPAGALPEGKRKYLGVIGKTNWAASAGGLPALVHGKKGGRAEQVASAAASDFEDF